MATIIWGGGGILLLFSPAIIVYLTCSCQRAAKWLTAETQTSGAVGTMLCTFAVSPLSWSPCHMPFIYWDGLRSHLDPAPDWYSWCEVRASGDGFPSLQE